MEGEHRRSSTVCQRETLEREDRGIALIFRAGKTTKAFPTELEMYMAEVVDKNPHQALDQQIFA